MKNTIFSLLFILLLTTIGLAQKPTETTRKAALLLNAGNVNGAMEILNDGISKEKDLLES